MKLSFRQIHLDFHTSEHIPGIGSDFSKEQFQQMLKVGHVSSITVFSKCHHGWAYHPTKANEMHPQLNFDLLKAQIEAAHEIGVKTPVYISAGYDEKTRYIHPEWQTRMRSADGSFSDDPTQARYRILCMNTPYLDYLLDQITEVCENYDADGIFLDIVAERECYCAHCMNTMLARGWDPRDRENAKKLATEVYANYTRRVRETVDAVKPGLPVFHNAGHITVGRRDLVYADTHLELESLPTGGWGYDHFPMSVAYTRNLGMEYLGMTGKFHNSWGDFGGYKHKNALRYEAALSIANGAKCSVGDQLHPRGEMNEATYRLIGAAYAEVEQKEAWCDEVRAVTDVAVLSTEAFTQVRNHPHNRSDIGATRMLLETHQLFDILDMESDFAPYKVLILPDEIPLTPALKDKLDAYVAQGGKLLVSGNSCLESGGGFPYDLGCEYIGKSQYQPAYVQPLRPLANMDQASFTVHEEGHVLRCTEGGTELARREQSYFNRDIRHYCSHRHTPNSGVVEGSAITVGKDGAYIGWGIFREYANVASLVLRDLFQLTLETLLGDRQTLKTALPAQGVTTLMDQAGERRLVHHLLYAVPVKRGNGIEIIEDIVPLYNIACALRTDKVIQRVYLAPQMEEVPFTQEGGVVRYTVGKLENHQMVVLDY